METKSTVTPLGDGGSVHTGEAATRRFQLLAVRSALKLHKQTGMQLRRGVNIIRTAQACTGLKTRDHNELINKLTLMVRELESQIEFKQEGT